MTGSRVVVVQVVVAFLCRLAAARAIQTMLLLSRGMMDALLRGGKSYYN